MSNAAFLMTKARTKMLLMQPFFGHLVMNLKLVETKNSMNGFNTAATDGYHIWYDADFIEKISKDKSEYVNFVLGHEVLHVVFNHLTRRGNRKPKLWNFACDYVINAILKESGFMLLPGILYDAKYDGMTSEQVYDLLEKEEKKNPSSQSGKSTMDSHPGDDDYPGGGEPGQPGQPGQSGTMTQEQADALEDKWKDILVKAANSAGADQVPGSIKRLIESFTTPKIKWHEVLRKCISEYTKADYTWMRPNRRHFSSGIILPSMDKQQKINIAVAVDTSGSISSDDITAFMSEIKGIVAMYDEYEVNAAYFDTSVHNPSTFSSESGFEEFVSNVAGRGGTTFESWWYHADKNDWLRKANAVVFFTDGYPGGAWIPSDVHHNEIFWVVKGSTNKAPVGTTLFYDD